MMLESIGLGSTAPTEVLVDNKAAETVARDPVMHSNMKHVARRHYYAREMQAAGEIKVGWVDTKLNVADVLTKAMAAPRFEALAAMMRRSSVLAGRALAAMRAALVMED